MSTRHIIYLTKSDLLKIHKKVVEESGEDEGILFRGNLELCVEIPARDVFGFELYKNIVDKACSLLFWINKLHPFIAGNKRTAYQAATIMLLNNGYTLRAKMREAVAISLGLAGCYLCYRQANKWLRSHSRRTAL